MDSQVLFEISKARALQFPGIGVPQTALDVRRFVESYSSWHRFDAVNDILGGHVASIRLAAEAFVKFQSHSISMHQKHCRADII
mmetsp:Transcript_8090/g.9027  ORF Transcript_8090/g.9027 Transcript_8090/m.9027 type:complete len:84 (-) Transcript_8090:329-580(-)